MPARPLPWCSYLPVNRRPARTGQQQVVSGSLKSPIQSDSGNGNLQTNAYPTLYVDSLGRSNRLFRNCHAQDRMKMNFSFFPFSKSMSDDRQGGNEALLLVVAIIMYLPAGQYIS